MLIEQGSDRNKFQTNISALQFGDHIYFSYDLPTNQLPVLTSFLRVGLESGQQCIHVTDDLSEEEVVKALQEIGVDVEAEMERGALHFLSKWEWRQQEELDPAVMVKGLASLVLQAQLAGYSGSRIWVDMTWTLEPAVDVQKLEAWETLLHQVIQHVPVILVCSYNWHRLSASVLKVGAITHPLRIDGDRIVTNDRSRLAALFLKHAPLLRRLDPPFRRSSANRG